MRNLISPATRDKMRRFRKMKRAWISFCLLTGLFVFSLFSEVIAHGTPWLVRFNGSCYLPRIQQLQSDLFLSDGVLTRPDYRTLAENEDLFGEESGNWMLWAPIRFSPEDTLPPENIEVDERIQISLNRVQRVADIRVASSGAQKAGRGADWFLERGGDIIPAEVQRAMELRFANEPSPEVSARSDDESYVWELTEYKPRSRAPRTVRIILREVLKPDLRGETFYLTPGEAARPDWWSGLEDPILALAEERLVQAETVPVSPVEFTDAEDVLREIRISKETVQYPFRPVKHHFLGLDHTGRDVFVLILYATRISMIFGLLLVLCSTVIGTVIGGIQGYYGGKVDLLGQRVIEIYSAIPFLYAMIFLGSVFGQSFGLLLFIYAIFNWIGISYYMRAEFLRLRKQPFTEAAQSLGLSTSRVMWKHILPNSLIPIITFFPFSLVGAIGSLSALDYLGFGLPVGTPSWGDLLSQGQEYRYAWWLILYPSLMLFTVILLSVFIGEGLRSAFDPKREVQWDA